MIRRAVDKALAPEVLSGRKITTIRGEPWPVGRPIMLYSWSGHPYRTKQVNVAAIIVTEFCGIGITHRPDGVMLYSHEMHLERPLYDCEGFATQEDMDAWFRQAVPRGTLYAQRALMRFRLWEGADAKLGGPRFAVYPGEIRSRVSGEVHYIGFARLCELYKVPPALCVDMSRPEERRGRDLSKLVALRPSYRGHYALTASERGPCPWDTNGDGDCHKCSNRPGGCTWKNAQHEGRPGTKP